MNSEYYPGWLDYWGVPHNTQIANISAKSFDNYLSYQNASVSVYMAHGGTSFGFEAGSFLRLGLIYKPQHRTFPLLRENVFEN